MAQPCGLLIKFKVRGDGQECPSHIIGPNLHAVGALADQGEEFGAGFFFLAEAA
jgi:hypothetical protein